MEKARREKALREMGTALVLVSALAACAAPAGDDEAFTQQEVSTRAATALRDGALVVRASVPAWTESCASCADVDHDGLVDAWEDALLDRLRPRMALHPDEPLIGDPDGRFGYVARVFRPEGGPRDVVRVIVVTGFSFDPGVLLFGKIPLSAHDGDSERVAIELSVRGDGREAVLRRAYFAAHEHTPNDHSRVYSETEVKHELTYGKDPNGQPRWVVFPSRAKHPVFPNAEVCAETSLKGTGLFRERCAKSEAEGHPVLPPIVNAGEPEHHRVDDLAAVGFPGDEAWVEQRFCGGFRAKPRLGGGCAESIAEKLLDDPFADSGDSRTLTVSKE